MTALAKESGHSLRGIFGENSVGRSRLARACGVGGDAGRRWSIRKRLPVSAWSAFPTACLVVGRFARIFADEDGLDSALEANGRVRAGIDFNGRGRRWLTAAARRASVPHRSDPTAFSACQCCQPPRGFCRDRRGMLDSSQARVGELCLDELGVAAWGIWLSVRHLAVSTCDKRVRWSDNSRLYWRVIMHRNEDPWPCAMPAGTCRGID
jgi:hypothetical protein